VPRPALGEHLEIVQRYLDYVVAAETGRGHRAAAEDRLAGALEPPQSTAAHVRSRSLLVRDVMTTDVTAVEENASYKQIVTTLVEHRLAAVPVINRHRVVVGIVSESDLLARIASGRGGLPRGHHHAELGRRLHGATAVELMTRPAITTSPDVTVAEAAQQSAHDRVHRLPVVDADGRLVGVVSRGDLLRTFLRPDREIEQEIRNDIVAGRMALDRTTLTVTVHQGTVTLGGAVESAPVMAALLDQVRAVGGVVAIRNELAVSQRQL